MIPPGCPCPAVLTIQDLSFERDPAVMRRLGAAALPHRRAALGASCRADPRDLGADARRPRRAATGSRPSGSSSPRSASTPTSGPAARGGDYLLLVGAIEPRKDPLAAATGGACRRTAARRRGPDARRGPRARAPRRGRRPPRLRAEARADPPLPGGGLRPLPVALRGLRPAGGRGDGLRHPGRRPAGRGPARGRGRRRRVRRRRPRRRRANGSRRRASACRPRGSSGRSGSRGRRRPGCTAAVYRELLA